MNDQKILIILVLYFLLNCFFAFWLWRHEVNSKKLQEKTNQNIAQFQDLVAKSENLQIKYLINIKAKLEKLESEI